MSKHESFGWKEVPDITVRRGGLVLFQFKTVVDFVEEYADHAWNINIATALMTPEMIEEILDDNNNIYLDCETLFRSLEGEDIKKVMTYGPGYLERYEAGVSCDGDPTRFQMEFKAGMRITN